MRMNILKILLLLLPLSAMAENWNKWTLYPSYYFAQKVEPAGKDVFVIAGGNLYSYNLTDESLQTYTKITGLSNNGVRTIAWMKSLQQLVVAYENSCIDILSLNGDVVTLSELADKQMAQDKTVNSIYVQGQNAYITTGFGIVKLNVKDCYFSESYNIGKNVGDVVVKDGYIYALTSTGVIKGKQTDNLYDPSVWVSTSEPWRTLKPNDNAQNQYGTLFFDATNKCYWGNNADGKLTRYEKEGEDIVAKSSGVVPDGPYDKKCRHVYAHNGKVYSLPGGWSVNYGDDLDVNKNICVYNNGEWSMLDWRGTSNGIMWYGAQCIAVDPKDEKHVMVGAKTGIYEFYNNSFVRRYGKANGISGGSSSERYTVVTSLKYDPAGNLWIGNIGTIDKKSIKYIPAGAELYDGYHIPALDEEVTDANDIQGFAFDGSKVWFVNDCGYYIRGLFCYDTATKTFNQYLSRQNQDGSSLSCTYSDVAIDSKKNVWVASTVGLLYLPYNEVGNTSSPLYQHKVPRNDGTNYADYLLDNIECFSLVVDDKDNKWVGTSDKGVYYISSDNNHEIYHFTTDNSPLPSNTIFDISIDDATGVVYFATEGGLCSYNGDVKGNGGEVSENNVYAYPNPVTPDYTGEITVAGLYPNAQVKVLTSSGIVISEGIAVGGTFHWDGCDKRGNRVASGVYMIAATDEEGNEGVLTKVAVIK